MIILLKNILKNQIYISRKTGIKLCVSVCLSEEILTTFFHVFSGSSDDGGGGGGDTDAGRSDDERSLSSDSSGGGGGVVVVGDGCRSRSNSANSNNNNGKKDTIAAVDEVGGVISAGLNNSFNFFELPANAAAMPYNLELRNAGASGVWTKTQLPKGVKYGPFLGKWGPKPVDSRFAWEVSDVQTT